MQRTHRSSRRFFGRAGSRAAARTCLLLSVALLTGCPGTECPPWDDFPPAAPAADSRGPASATADQLVVYLDTSSSMAGYVSADRSGQTVFSRTLQELRNFSTIINPPLEVLVRRVDSTVGQPRPDSALSEASINPAAFNGSETDLAGAIDSFPRPSAQALAATRQRPQRGAVRQEPAAAVTPGPEGEGGESQPPPPPARFHILVTDGVQSTSRQREGANCVTGSDQLCVRRKIFDLMNKGWGAYVIGMRSEFSGKVYSEVSGAAVPYASKKRDPETFRPFYLYLFSPDRAALDKMVGTLKERLRPLSAQPESMRALALTSAYAGGAAPCDITVPRGETEALEVTKDSHDALSRFTLLVDPDTEKSGPQPFTIMAELPWSGDARDGGTPKELAGLVRWELSPVQPKGGEGGSGGGRSRLPELKVVRQQAGEDGKVAIEATAQWPPATGDLECRVYRLVGRLNLEQQTPPWVQRWSTNLDTTAEAGNRTLNLESALLGLWHNPELEKQVIAEIYIRVGPM